MVGTSKPWIINSKLKPPQGAVLHVERPRLLQLELPRMLLVSAPPGYGKTTYMSLLFDKLGEQGHVCAWLTLDEFDQSPEVLTTYVILSLTQAGVDLGHLEQIALEGFVSMPMDVAWSMIIHQLEQHSSPVVLFLDDYHRIENKSINDLTSFFIRRMPVTCHIVIGSRSHPNLGLTDFFSRGYLQIIDQQALRFDDSEMVRFLKLPPCPTISCSTLKTARKAGRWRRNS